jgi:hypothetical protein
MPPASITSYLDGGFRGKEQALRQATKAYKTHCTTARASTRTSSRPKFAQAAGAGAAEHKSRKEPASHLFKERGATANPKDGLPDGGSGTEQAQQQVTKTYNTYSAAGASTRAAVLIWHRQQGQQHDQQSTGSNTSSRAQIAFAYTLCLVGILPIKKLY